MDETAQVLLEKLPNLSYKDTQRLLKVRDLKCTGKHAVIQVRLYEALLCEISSNSSSNPTTNQAEETDDEDSLIIRPKGLKPKVSESMDEDVIITKYKPPPAKFNPRQSSSGRCEGKAKPRVCIDLEANVSVKKQESNNSDEEVICEKAVGKPK